jgi:hypothetical protein
MFSLMQLTPDAHGFSLAYHAVVGASLIALALAVACIVALRRAPMKRRWTAFAAIMVAGWSGLYFTTFKAAVTGESVSLYAFMQYDRVVPWIDTADIYLEQRAGRDAQIVVVDRQRRAVSMNVADLGQSDRERLVAFMAARVPRLDAERAAAVLDRQTPARSRTLFSEQQI